MRTNEWWEHKLVPALIPFYGAALVAGRPILPLLPSIGLLLVAVIPGAAYVSIVNDATDRSADLAAGKTNRLETFSTSAILALVSITAGLGTGFAYLWRDDTPLVGIYVAAWISFTLYSVPPFRLKERGLWGVVADAAGAHLCPALVAALLAGRAMQSPVNTVWLIAIALWSFGYGLRGILWHQLKDRDNDVATGTDTFAAQRPRSHTELYAAILVFPIELAGLALIVILVGGLLPLLLLAVHALIVAARIRFRRIYPSLVGEKRGDQVVLQDYYELFLPIALLLSSAIRHPADGTLIVLHLIAFRRRPAIVARDAWALGRIAARATLRRLSRPDL